MVNVVNGPGNPTDHSSTGEGNGNGNGNASSSGDGTEGSASSSGDGTEGRASGGDGSSASSSTGGGASSGSIRDPREAREPGRSPAPPTGDHPDTDWPEGLPRPVQEQAIPGGYIGRTSRAVLADGRTVVIKRCPYPVAQEADGLRALADAGAPVPEVLGMGHRLLVLQWLQGRPDWPALGRAVAHLHRHTANRFGWPIDNYVGRFPQDNTWTDDWPTFYVERRVLPQLSRASLPAELRRRIQHACAGPLRDLLRPNPPASLTHGDLWSGNMIDGRWLIDPAVSHADRELDLAYLSLSDDLPTEFMSAYLAEYPVDAGFDERRPALLLHKHLVNVRHFGDRVLPRLTALLDSYGW